MLDGMEAYLVADSRPLGVNTGPHGANTCPHEVKMVKWWG